MQSPVSGASYNMYPPPEYSPPNGLSKGTPNIMHYLTAQGQESRGPEWVTMAVAVLLANTGTLVLLALVGWSSPSMVYSPSGAPAFHAVIQLGQMQKAWVYITLAVAAGILLSDLTRALLTWGFKLVWGVGKAFVIMAVVMASVVVVAAVMTHLYARQPSGGPSSADSFLDVQWYASMASSASRAMEGFKPSFATDL
jgi:hypothetical protein